MYHRVKRKLIETSKFILNELAYNGHLQSMGSVGVYWLSACTLNNKASIWELILLYFIFQTIFLYDRYADYASDIESNVERSLHLKKYYEKIPFILIGLLLLIASILKYKFGLPMFYGSISILTLGILYPGYFKNLTKKIPLFKNYYVSTVYALLVFIPIIQGEEVRDYLQIYIILFLFVLLESMITQVSLDIKDVSSDKRDGLRTFPVLVGESATYTYLRIGTFFLGGLFILLSILFHISTIAVIIFITSMLVNLLVVNMLRRHNVYGYFLAAGKFSIWFVIVIFAKLVIS